MYDNLTIEEHLTYFYNLKGRNKAVLNQEVEKIIEKCSLANEKGKLAKNLSGGNKRKLCLGNALIGDSKMIFLD